MNPSELQKTVDNCIDHLEKGHTFLYPTDTIWGIGCNPFNENALNKIFALKNRSKHKSFILLVSSLEMLQKYVCNIPHHIFDTIENDKIPTTIIYSATKKLPDFLLADDGSIGIRVIKHPFATKLIEQYNAPIISTSANISGERSPTSFADVSEKIKSGVDFIIPESLDTSNQTKPSRILLQKKGGNIEWLRK